MKNMESSLIYEIRSPLKFLEDIFDTIFNFLFILLEIPKKFMLL